MPKGIYAHKHKTDQRTYAHHRITHLVVTGKLPKASTRRCVDCGRKANEWDHYKGYKFPEEVQPVCWKCHWKRGIKRGEHDVKNMGILNRRKTTCRLGHPLLGDNLQPGRLKRYGKRICRICFNRRARSYRQKGGGLPCKIKLSE